MLFQKKIVFSLTKTKFELEKCANLLKNTETRSANKIKPNENRDKKENFNNKEFEYLEDVYVQ